MPSEIAYAKINLALHVRRRRGDGYHDIESLFAFAEDGDRLEAEAVPDGALRLTIDGPFAGGLSDGADNLVMQAARALQKASATTQGASLRLTKNLPVASGIGGGSADAAAALRLLAMLWKIDGDLIMPIAARLGSDIPACVVSRTLVGTGRGEALDLRDLPGLAGMPLLLVNPGVPLSTAPVFAAWDGVDRGALDALSLNNIMEYGRNDLESPAIYVVPVIADILGMLASRPGVRLARMSGSGATCFALFDTQAARDAAAADIAWREPDWWLMKTRIRR